ncbi:MAG: decaprenyl-phosphate phosphoribosyltransferase [bacterium]
MVSALIISMRPHQWTKNGFIFAGLVFSQNVLHGALLLKTLEAFLAFCLLTGGVYIINDVIDLKEDRVHPQKRTRPIASGRVAKGTAFTVAALLVIFSLFFSFVLDAGFGMTALIYFLLMVAYSLFLKRVVILDVLAISAGFILRVVAGAVLVGVHISSWLLTCTIFLSLFLALGKRRYELVTMDPGSGGHRQVMESYSLTFVDQLIAVAAASTLLSYALYTMSAATVKKFGSENLRFTIPFVVYGIFRYLYLIHVRQEGDNPGKVLFSDRPLLIDVALWVVVVGLILYA